MRSVRKKELMEELMAETAPLDEKQILETEARKWKTKEELAKAKAGLSVYHDVPVDDIQIKQESAQQSWGNQGRKCLVQEIRSISIQKLTLKTNYRIHETNLIKG